MRHAKAVDEDVGGDHARGLSPRGQADAAALAVWLKEQGLMPELTLCSTASRTRQTLAAIAGPQWPVILSDRLYLASVGEMLSQIQATDDAVNTLAMLCHNPGAHALAGLLAGEYANEADADKLMLKFPTAACAVIDFDAAHWREVKAGAGLLRVLRY